VVNRHQETELAAHRSFSAIDQQRTKRTETKPTKPQRPADSLAADLIGPSYRRIAAFSAWSEHATRLAIKHGQLPCFMISSRWYAPRSELAAALTAKRGVGHEPPSENRCPFNADFVGRGTKQCYSRSAIRVIVTDCPSLNADEERDRKDMMANADRGHITADIKTVRRVTQQIVHEIQQNPSIRARLKRDPRRFLADRGLSVDWQRALLRDSGAPKSRLAAIDCGFTCVCATDRGCCLSCWDTTILFPQKVAPK
jgi:hypothetical protein